MNQTNWKFSSILKCSGCPCNKHILIGVVLLLLLGAGILGYQLLQPKSEQTTVVPEVKVPEKFSEDETASWQTYRNEEFGFELKYPSDWVVSSLDQPTSLLIYFGPKELGTPLVFVVTETIQDFEEQKRLLFENYNITVLETRERKVAGIKAEHLIVSQSTGSPAGIISFTKDNLGFILAGWEEVEGAERLIILNQILSTFQFIEKESLTQSSDLKGFCDDTTEVFEFEKPINFSDALENEMFVVCSDSSWQQWPQGGQGVLSLWVVKQQRDGYDVFWGRKTLDELNLRNVAVPEILDVNNDGIDEIFISGSNWGGTCTGSIDYYYLYEPSQDEMFSLQSKEWFDESCENLIKYPLEISKNLENDEYSVFKQFLEKKLSTK